MEHLLDSGAVAVASSTTNKTALHFACQAGHTNVVVCLLNRLPALLAIDDSPQETSLHIAAREGHVEIVRNLLAVAARAEQLKTPEGSVKVEEAYLYGSEEEKVIMNDVLPEIIVDVLAPSSLDKKTPLHEAAENGHTEVVKLLIEYMREYRVPKRPSIDALAGHSPHWGEGLMATPPKQGESPLKASIVPGIDTFTVKGQTAFHEAARKGHFEVMENLLQAGADINAIMRPSQDITALVQASLMGRVDVVRFLLQHGATDARLKALTRTLRKQENKEDYDAVVGVLLCYNGGIHQLSADVRSRSKPAENSAQPASTVMLDVSWNSKFLPYIRREWLQLPTTELPRPKDQTVAVTQLDISSNILTEVPLEIFQLPHLTQLEMGKNQLKALPTLLHRTGGGWTCQKLSQLEINSNEFTSLPACLFALPELKELNANNNKIREVPAAIWTAPKLQKVYLNRNRLEVFPFPEETSPCGSPASPTYLSFEKVEQNTSLPDSGYAEFSPGRMEPADDVTRPRRRSLVLPFSTPSSSLTSRSRGATTGAGRKGGQAQTQFMSRRFESFISNSLEEEEFEDLDTPDLTEGKESSPLEVLDLSHNALSSVPAGLSCLAPKLQKLNVSYNNIKSLGSINDYPLDIEMLDATQNELHTAIAPITSEGRNYQPCARRQLGGAQTMSGSLSASSIESSLFTFSYKPCAHRAHRNLRRLATLKLSNNQLVDLQLFRLVSRNKSGDLTASFEESTMTLKQMVNTASDPFAMVVSPSTPRPASSSPREEISKSVMVSQAGSGKRGKEPLKQMESSNSSPSNSSQEGSGSGQGAPPSPSMIISPLFPQLSTLEVARNRLRSVPSHLYLITNLSCLVISHNPDIDTLPLELSNLDHLWNLEYEGCPLTNPPAGDLDKYRLAADKLLYMRSLLHE